MTTKTAVKPQLAERWAEIAKIKGERYQPDVHEEPKYITINFVDWKGDETKIEKARVGETLLETAKRFWLPIPGTYIYIYIFYI